MQSKAECGTTDRAENFLQNGVDSSTDFHALFKLSFLKKFVAPSTVKNINSIGLRAKKACDDCCYPLFLNRDL